MLTIWSICRKGGMKVQFGLGERENQVSEVGASMGVLGHVFHFISFLLKFGSAFSDRGFFVRVWHQHSYQSMPSSGLSFSSKKKVLTIIGNGKFQN